jgi:hypothetical protein
MRLPQFAIDERAKIHNPPSPGRAGRGRQPGLDAFDTIKRLLGAGADPVALMVLLKNLYDLDHVLGGRR